MKMGLPSEGHIAEVASVTDWFIPEGLPSRATIYPGARALRAEFIPVAEALHALAVTEAQRDVDFRIDFHGVAFRGHAQRTVKGRVFMLRRIATDLRRIYDLGLPRDVVRLLVHEDFAQDGGLVIICGNPGHGKSTTASALVVERVKRLGSFALTVEQPPEYEIQGEYPGEGGVNGKLIQVPARDESFADDLRDALRCYPSHTRGPMLYVGEVRDAQTAVQLLRAAVNGQLVISTMHAGDIVAGLERLLALARDVLGRAEAAMLLSHSLRLCMHQAINNGSLSSRFLFSANPSSGPAALIKRAGMSEGDTHLQMLSTEIEAQRAWLDNDKLLDKLLPKRTSSRPDDPRRRSARGGVGYGHYQATE